MVNGPDLRETPGAIIEPNMGLNVLKNFCNGGKVLAMMKLCAIK